MKQKFQISKIESEVFAREENPYGEYKMDFPWPDQEFDDNDYSHTMWAMKQEEWQKFENQVQEYPLTEESGKMLLGKKSCEVFDMIIENGLTPQNFVEKLYDKMINQEITGEIVIENGVKKIKI